MNRRSFLKKSILVGVALFLDPTSLLPTVTNKVRGEINPSYYKTISVSYFDAGYVYAPYISLVRGSVWGKQG